ncbi:hypothetical protein [Kitasatospora sp. NPDC051914]|uniref:hypothetical protein n=1 Tax=Kitasatospora sp. NPDC051914 TaxID=3154945 RepID=UPI003436ED4D
MDAYEWSGRTVEYHRAQIRGHLGFRECSVADADKLTAWLAEHVACKERRPVSPPYPGALRPRNVPRAGVRHTGPSTGHRARPAG